MRIRILAVLLVLVLLLAGCALIAPSAPEASGPANDAGTKPAPARTETTPASTLPAKKISFVKTEWESDYLVDENGQTLYLSDLIDAGTVSEPFRIRFYENGFVYVDYLQLSSLRGTWVGYMYSEDNGLVIDFPTDQVNSYTLVSASAEAIELKNELGQVFHYVPAPYEGN